MIILPMTLSQKSQRWRTCDAYSGLGDMDKAESYYVKAAGHGENEF